MLDDEIIEEERPVAEGPAIIRRLPRPVDLIPAIDVDPQGAMPARPQGICQHREKGSMRSLKEEEGLGSAVSHGDARQTKS